MISAQAIANQRGQDEYILNDPHFENLYKSAQARKNGEDRDGMNEILPGILAKYPAVSGGDMALLRIPQNFRER